MTMSRPFIIATNRTLVDLCNVLQLTDAGLEELAQRTAASHPDSMPVTRDRVVVGTLVNIRVENGCIVGDYEEAAK